MLTIKAFTFNPLGENTYVLSDETQEAVIIDPGCYEKDEQEELADYIKTKQLKVVKLLNTHGHVDHVLGNYFVKEQFKVPLLIYPGDEATLRAVAAYAQSYGFVRYTPAEPDGYLEEGSTVTFGNTKLKILFVPGHAPGHIAFLHEESKQVIAGDVLFYESIGRADLPGGNFNTLIKSIHTQLFTLPDETKVYPGHGPATTIAHEKKYNPFCAIK